MKEFITCPRDGCDVGARWDEDDQQYSCNNCGMILKVIDPNAKNPNTDESVVS